MLYNVSNCDFVATFDCLLQGYLQSVLSLVKGNVLKCDPTNSNIPNVHVPAEECDWAIATFSYYKSCRFNPKCELNIIIENRPAIDAGGVCQTFFLSCMRKLSLVTWVYLKGRLRPAFKLSVLNSKSFGLMIGQLENQEAGDV